MIRLSHVLITIAFVALILGGCGIGGVQGSGSVASENRQVSGFDAVELSGFGELIIQQGEQETLLIEADDNLISLIETTVVDNRLMISTKPNTNITGFTKLTYTVTLPELRAISVSGAGSVVGNDIAAESLTVETSGAGVITLSGSANEQTVNLSGFGNYDAKALESQRATVQLSGAGNAELRVSEQLDAQISGAGSITYIGNPQVNQDISGAGRIAQANE